MNQTLGKVRALAAEIECLCVRLHICFEHGGYYTSIGMCPKA